MGKINFEDIYLYGLLTEEQKKYFEEKATLMTLKKGERIYSNADECLGFFAVQSGQIRAFNVSSNGRELTLFRLIEGDNCFITASCMLSVKIDVQLSVEKDSELVVFPTCALKDIVDESIKVSLYANQMLATRLQETMWIMDQTLFKSFDTRLALFLIEESALEEGNCLKITHDEIANHLGTAREVVSRMLKMFQNDGMVKMDRGSLQILDKQKLIEISKY